MDKELVLYNIEYLYGNNKFSAFTNEDIKNLKNTIDKDRDAFEKIYNNISDKCKDNNKIFKAVQHYYLYNVIKAEPLTGTEKQIKWADDIKAEWVCNVSDLFYKNIILRLQKDKEEKKKLWENKEVEKKEIVKLIANKIYAKWFIDNRYNFVDVILEEVSSK